LLLSATFTFLSPNIFRPSHLLVSKMLSGIFGFLTKRDVQKDLDGLKKMLEHFQSDNLIINEELLQTLVTLVNIHYKQRKIVLIGCHVMSNIALDEHHAIAMIQKGAAKALCKVLKKHEGDSRVVWKASSALWNLCRPQNIATHIPKQCADLVFNCLVNNATSSRATHTCLGALSNLALVCPNIFKKVMNIKNLQALRRIIQRYKAVSEICGHFGALVANMSVCAELAEACVSLEFVDLLISCLEQGNLKTDEAVKHVVAALHNLSDVAEFNSHLCLAEGVEILRQVQRDHEGEISDFVEGIFDLGGLPMHATTSLHVAVVCCHLPVIVQLLKKSVIDIEELDRQSKTALDLALASGIGETVELLIASGANISCDSADMLEEEQMRAMKRYVKRGKSHRFRSQNKMRSLVRDNAKLVNDMGTVVTSYIAGVDLLLVLQ